MVLAVPWNGAEETIKTLGDLADNDDDAKRLVSELAAAMGFQPVDVGGIKNARPLESMPILHIVPYLAGKRDAAFEWAVRGTGNKSRGRQRLSDVLMSARTDGVAQYP